LGPTKGRSPMRKRIVAVLAALLMAVAVPAWAAEYDGGYKDCPSNENMVLRTRTTYYSEGWVWATAGSGYHDKYDFGPGWTTTRHITQAIDGTWQAAGVQLSQVWTWAYCD